MLWVRREKEKESINCWYNVPVWHIFFHIWGIYLTTQRELRWKAPSSHQIVISVWSLFTLKTLPGTMPNVTILLIIYYNMISNAFCSLHEACLWLCVEKCCLFFELSGWNICLQAFSDSWTSTAVNPRAWTWSLITAVLHVNKILPCFYKLKVNLWFWARLSLTQALPLCCMTGIVWCENIAPCWFAFVHWLIKPAEWRRTLRLGSLECSRGIILSFNKLTCVFLCYSSVFHLQQPVYCAAVYFNLTKPNQN